LQITTIRRGFIIEIKKMKNKIPKQLTKKQKSKLYKIIGICNDRLLFNEMLYGDKERDKKYPLPQGLFRYAEREK
jgi:hypothetical protein